MGDEAGLHVRTVLVKPKAETGKARIKTHLKNPHKVIDDTQYKHTPKRITQRLLQFACQPMFANNKFQPNFLRENNFSIVATYWEKSSHY